MKKNCNNKRGVLFVNFALLLLLLLFPVVRSSCFCRSGTATHQTQQRSCEMVAFKLLDSSLKLSPSVFHKKTETITQVCPRSWTHNDFQKDTCSRFQHPGILFLIQHPGFNSAFKNKIKKKLKQKRPKNVGETANERIDDTNLNDASVGTKAQNVGVAATKYNANGMGFDNVPPTNDDTLDYLASGAACQERRENKCPLGKAGTTMCC
jgi:hypothetical protein